MECQPTVYCRETSHLLRVGMSSYQYTKPCIVFCIWSQLCIVMSLTLTPCIGLKFHAQFLNLNTCLCVQRQLSKCNFVIRGQTIIATRLVSHEVFLADCCNHSLQQSLPVWNPVPPTLRFAHSKQQLPPEPVWKVVPLALCCNHS